MEDTLVNFGSEIKAVTESADGWQIKGWLVQFDVHDQSHLRDKFLKSTDFDIEDGEARTLYYNHGLDPTFGKAKLGKARLYVKDAGVWLEGEIKRRRDHLEAHVEHLVDGLKKKVNVRNIECPAFALSGGAPAHLVERKSIDGGHEITMWPLAEASITPTPAEITTCVSLKSLIELEADEETKKYDPRQPRDDHGKWTDSATGKLSVGHAIHVMKHEGITDEKHHEAVRAAIESGQHKSREDVLKHIDSLHGVNGTNAPKGEAAEQGGTKRSAEQSKLIDRYAAALFEYNKDYHDQLREQHPKEQVDAVVERDRATAKTQAEKIAATIDSGDIAALAGRLTSSNPLSVAFFEGYTGHRLGRTNSEIQTNLNKWSDGALSQHNAAQAAADKEASASRAASDTARSLDEYGRTITQGGRSRAAHFAELVHENGATHIESKKEGAVTRHYVAGVYPTGHRLAGHKWTARIQNKQGVQYLQERHGLTVKPATKSIDGIDDDHAEDVTTWLTERLAIDSIDTAQLKSTNLHTFTTPNEVCVAIHDILQTRMPLSWHAEAARTAVDSVAARLEGHPEVKAGRVISADNHRELDEACAALKTAYERLMALVEAHRPEINMGVKTDELEALRLEAMLIEAQCVLSESIAA